MKPSDFEFEMPEELIAQEPAEKRTGSRLMVVHRKTGRIEHRKFTDILEFLVPGDVMVFNDTRVIPARLLGEKENTGGRVEALLLHNIRGNTWEAMVRPGRRIKPGHTLVFGGGIIKGRIKEITPEGTRIIDFEAEDFWDALYKVGKTPLPPYINKPVQDPERYQTVFAKKRGSSAAPTAALHFSDEILKEIDRMGVLRLNVTLHIGPGTFRPVKSVRIQDHVMHREYFSVKDETLKKIADAKSGGRRIIPVGTTSTRVLESVFDENMNVLRTSGWTDIFIYPGYKFKAIDALVTNFHLPRSTLIMLVSALSGRELILSAYRQAVEGRYRFFSFGDCMLII